MGGRDRGIESDYDRTGTNETMAEREQCEDTTGPFLLQVQFALPLCTTCERVRLCKLFKYPNFGMHDVRLKSNVGKLEPFYKYVGYLTHVLSLSTAPCSSI